MMPVGNKFQNLKNEQLTFDDPIYPNIKQDPFFNPKKPKPNNVKHVNNQDT
jgi:hypothetical protein